MLKYMISAAVVLALVACETSKSPSTDATVVEAPAVSVSASAAPSSSASVIDAGVCATDASADSSSDVKDAK